jgi:hypothetical protein
MDYSTFIGFNHEAWSGFMFWHLDIQADLFNTWEFSTIMTHKGGAKKILFLYVQIMRACSR